MKASELLAAPLKAGDLLAAAAPPATDENVPAMLPAHAQPFGPRPVTPYSGAPDLPLIHEYPENDIAGMALFGPAGRVVSRAIPGLAAAPWLVRAATSGALTNAGVGATQDVMAGRNPIPGVVPNLVGGAVMNPALEGLSNVLRRTLPFPQPRAGVPEPVPATGGQPVPERVPEGAPVVPAPVSAEPVPTNPQPLEPTTRSNQFPEQADFVKQVESDPNYLKRIDELGGGRRVTNRETIAKAFETPLPTPEEIAAHKAGTPVNEVDVVRGGIVVDHALRQWQSAIASGDKESADALGASIGQMLPGYHNLTATPGRATQAQSLFALQKLTDVWRQVSDLQQRNLPFDELTAQLKTLGNETNKAAKLQKAGGVVQDIADKIQTYGTMMKLTSPVTHAYNTISNALTFLTLQPVEKVARASALEAQGNPVAADAEMKYLFGTSQGLVDGARRYLKVLMQDAPEIGGKTAAEGVRGGTGGPKWTRPFNPFRQLSAADAFWKGILRDQDLKTRAYAAAAGEGLKGSALAKRIEDLASNPPQAWSDAADRTAEEVTFQQAPDTVVKALNALSHKVRGMRLVIPFISTPYNLMRFQFQRSLPGIASPRNLSGLYKGGQEQAEAVGRLGAGAAMALAAWALVKRGEVTGAYPTDPQERSLWELEGRQPYSFRVGDHWVNYGRLQPVSQYLLQAVALRDAIDQNPGDVGKAFTNLMVSSIKGLSDQPFLSGMSSLLDAIQDPERSGQKFVAGTLTGLVPNVLRDVRNQTDVFRRDARGVVPSVVNMVPGASSTLPVKRDAFGRPIGMEANPALRATKASQPVRSTPETAALREAGTAPVKPLPVLRTNRGDIQLDAKQFDQFQTELGQARQNAIREAAGDPGFAGLDPDVRAARLARLMDNASNAVAARWKYDLSQKLTPRKGHRRFTP